MRCIFLAGLVFAAGSALQPALAAPLSRPSPSTQLSQAQIPGDVASGFGYTTGKPVGDPIRRQLLRIRSEGLALQAKDGGALTTADRESLQARLNALHGLYGAHLLRTGD